MKRILTYCLKGSVLLYQKLLSPFLGRQCRFYPTCSNYALWLFDFNKPLVALYKTSYRILKCNPFHNGGIDYPKLTLTLTITRFYNDFKQKPIKYWLIPYKNPMFFVTISYPKQIQCLFVIIKTF